VGTLTRLPAHLEQWAPALDPFARDLQPALLALVGRLAAAIGPLSVSHGSVDGEPDGFDGLERKGPYDRLLASEWLLADEVPDEFIRRAAAREHVFLRLARPEPSGDRFSLALFDAGPSQLGAPRLVHLALLVLLARRAAAVPARFAWGIVQEPAGDLGTAADEAAVGRLVDARTAEEVSPEHVAGWTARVRAAQRRPDDLWWIGGATLAGFAAGSGARVQVDDVLEPGTRRLAASIVRPGRPPVIVPLDLPADSVCTRLVRDPFGRSAAILPVRPKSPRPASNLLFAWNGTSVLARMEPGGVVSYPVPHSPRDPTAPPKKYFTHRGVVAVLRRQRTLTVAIAHPRGLQLQAFSKAGHPEPGVYEDTAVLFDPNGPLQALWPRSSGATRVQASLVDARGGLFALTLAQGVRRVVRIAHGPVHAAGWRDDGPVFAMRQPETAPRAIGWFRMDDALVQKGLLGFDADRVLIGANPVGASEPFTPVGSNTRDRDWRFSGDRELLLVAPEGSTVLGVVVEEGTVQPGLVILQADGRQLSILGRNWSRDLGRAPGTIEQMTVDPRVRRLAYSTPDELVVVDLVTGGVLLRAVLA
jgi:hypothetical protein